MIKVLFHEAASCTTIGRAGWEEGPLVGLDGLSQGWERCW
jgi:hypothetical protein